MQEQEIAFPKAPQSRRYTPAQRAAILRARKKRKAERRRNQIIFLSLCAVVLVLLVVGAIKLVLFGISTIKGAERPDDTQVGASSVVTQGDVNTDVDADSDVTVYEEVSYDLTNYQYDATDPRLILVNTNLPLDENYVPQTVVADDATAATLEPEAAASYRAMASAAAADGVMLVLTGGYYDVPKQQDLFDEWKQHYLGKGETEEQAYLLAQSVVGAPCASEHQTGYGADILSSEYGDADTGFAESAAFAWLARYAAEYGFVQRYPENKQMITGRVYEPWHWRYVGVENAKAMVETGLCLEEFVELRGEVV